MTTAMALDLPTLRRGCWKGSAGQDVNFRVFGRGGPHDWAPPALPRCVDVQPKHYKQGRVKAAKQRLRLQQAHVDQLDLHGVRGDVDGFKAILIHKYGGTARGWRVAFAPDNIGIRPVAFNQFCAAVKRIGYNGQALTLWRNLAGTSPSVRLDHLEPELAEQLDALTKAITSKFSGGCPEAWREMERAHGTRIDFEEFEAFLTKRRLVPRRPKVDLRWVFDLLDVKEIGTITCDDFRYLDHWAKERLGVALPAEPEVEKIEEERYSPPPREAPAEPTTLEDFRVFLMTRFGSPAKAWRAVIDLKGTGVLGKVEFGKGCRAAGWKHHHGPLFQQMEEAGGGLVTLRTLDPETAAAIDKLHEAAGQDAGVGDLHGVWSEVLDPQCTGIVARSLFVRELRSELGLTADQARLLFLVLDVANTGWVAKEEFDFLEMFETRLPAARGAALPREMRGSMSSPSITLSSSPSLSSPARAKDHITSPAKSTRKSQVRHLAHAQRVKDMHLTKQVPRHCSQGSLSDLEASRSTTLRATRGTPQTDLFRSTSQFYREGVKKIMTFQQNNQEKESVFEEDSGDEEQDGEF